MCEFPPFQLDTVNQLLLRRASTCDHERVRLTPKAFSVLRCLVERAGRLVTPDELLDAAWPGVYVEPQTVKSHILQIRDALGDDRRSPVYIETLHKRGYRFIAHVRSVADPQQAPAPAAPTCLVGRAQALGELNDGLRRTLQGERQIAFITGETGIGKTALLDAFGQQVAGKTDGVRIALGQCIEGYGGKEPYYPMLEALGQLCHAPGGESVVATLEAQAPTWLVQFPALVKREHRDTLQREILGATRERMLREISEALETITAHAPLLLAFEDLQWVDPSTVDLISVLSRRRAPARLMLIGTWRQLDLQPAGPQLMALKQDLLMHKLCREVALDPLSQAQIVEYLTVDSPGTRETAGLADVIYRRSEGNPLFMVAVLDHMTRRGFISRQNGAWRPRVPLEAIDPEVPDGLCPMIEAQLGRLSAEEHRALEAASVNTGLSFSVSATAAAAQMEPEPFEELCERLSRQNSIVRSVGPRQLPDGSVSHCYDFVHAFYRELLFRRIATRRRARLHQCIGKRLEALYSGQLGEAASELAHHFERGADWPRAIKYLHLAAETARRRCADREATALLCRANELASKLARPD